MKNDYLTIGPLQIRILKSLWKLERGSVHDILADWKAEGARDIPVYVTVLTVLRRLEARGLLSHTVSGRSFVYRPVTEEYAFKVAMVTRFAETLFGGLSPLATFLADEVLFTSNAPAFPEMMGYVAAD